VTVEVRAVADMAAEDAERSSQQCPPPHTDRRDEVEAQLEGRLRRNRERDSPRVRVRAAVRDERESRAAKTKNLELRLQMASVGSQGFDNRSGDRSRGRRRSGASAPPRVRLREYAPPRPGRPTIQGLGKERSFRRRGGSRPARRAPSR
jgi:hypothetical protein